MSYLSLQLKGLPLYIPLNDSTCHSFLPYLFIPLPIFASRTVDARTTAATRAAGQQDLMMAGQPLGTLLITFGQASSREHQ